MKLVYLAGSPYSGSTLLSLVLNEHPEITTVGHMMGWKFGEDDDFRCSCGELVKECPFFEYIGNSFHKAGLRFSVYDFDTEYKCVNNERFNRFLLGRLPLYSNDILERIRDCFVTGIPGVNKRLKELDERNRVFIQAALEYNKASVFVDNSHDPHRLKHLHRAFGDQLYVVHIVRDIRGVALSNINNKAWPVTVSQNLWLKRQEDTTRILRSLDIQSLRLMYEKFCESPGEELKPLFNILGIKETPVDGELGKSEHHVLGNDMRMSARKIALKENWRDKLNSDDLSKLNMALQRTRRSTADPDMKEIVDYYLSR